MKDYELAVGNDVVNSKRHSHQKATESRAKKKINGFSNFSPKDITIMIIAFYFHFDR